MKQKCERNYGIDLLRIVLMFMVCMLHTLGQGGVLKSCEEGSAKYAVFYLIEVMCYCAVDAFALISGYMASNKPSNHSKIVEMWFQVLFYSLAVTLLLSRLSVGKVLKIKEVFKAMFPVISDYYWYFTAYVALFFAMPVINFCIFKIDENSAKKMLLIIFFLYTVIGLIKDPFKTKGGYCAIWLIVLYCAGGLSKKAEVFKNKKTSTLVLFWFACIALTWALKIFGKLDMFCKYISPTVLLSGLLMVVIFSRLRLKGTIIKKISPLAFGIYLFQLNKIIWKYVIKNHAAFAADMNIFYGVLCSFAFALAIFAAGLAVEYLRTLLFKLLRISKLSDKIVFVSKKAAGKMIKFFD